MFAKNAKQAKRLGRRFVHGGCRGKNHRVIVKKWKCGKFYSGGKIRKGCIFHVDCVTKK